MVGNSQWFEDMLEELGHEVWIGDAAQILAASTFFALPEQLNLTI